VLVVPDIRDASISSKSCGVFVCLRNNMVALCYAAAFPSASSTADINSTVQLRTGEKYSNI